MKKNYIKPEITQIEIELSSMLAGSLNSGDTDVDVDYGGESGGGMEADSKDFGYDIWED